MDSPAKRNRERRLAQSAARAFKGWREARVAAARARKKAYDRARYAANRALVDALKLASGCVDCGANGDAAFLEWDHVRGEKVKNVADLIVAGKRTLGDEIAKCAVRCKPCHRARHKRG
jgi:hypothetical protein